MGAIVPNHPQSERNFCKSNALFVNGRTSSTSSAHTNSPPISADIAHSPAHQHLQQQGTFPQSNPRPWHIDLCDFTPNNSGHTHCPGVILTRLIVHLPPIQTDSSTQNVLHPASIWYHTAHFSKITPPPLMKTTPNNRGHTGSTYVIQTPISHDNTSNIPVHTSNNHGQHPQLKRTFEQMKKCDFPCNINAFQYL